jgi:hypothetical protein
MITKVSCPVWREAVGKGPAQVAPRWRPTRPEGQRKITRTRHSRHRQSCPTSQGTQRTGTRVGGPIRTPILWISTRPLLPRRDSNDLHHVARQESQAAMDSRRRPGRGIRPHRPRPATHQYRVVSRPGHDPTMAESRSDRERTSHPDRRRRPTRGRGDSSNAMGNLGRAPRLPHRLRA